MGGAYPDTGACAGGSPVLKPAGTTFGECAAYCSAETATATGDPDCWAFDYQMGATPADSICNIYPGLSFSQAATATVSAGRLVSCYVWDNV